MTTRNKTLFHSHESKRDFLVSKTDTDRLKEVKRHDVIDADQAVKTAHPDILSGDDFSDHALEQLNSVAQFSAMVIRLDLLTEKSDPNHPAGAIRIQETRYRFSECKRKVPGARGSGTNSKESQANMAREQLPLGCAPHNADALRLPMVTSTSAGAPESLLALGLAL